MALNYSDYSAVKTPVQGIMEGLQLGSSVQQIQERARLNQLKAQKIQQEQQSAAQMQSALGNFSTRKFASPEEKIKAINDLIIQFPALGEHYKSVTQNLTEEAKRNQGQKAMSIFNALQSGMTDQAKKMLEIDRDAAENSGDEGSARMTQSIIDMIDSGFKDQASDSALMYAVTEMGVDKAIDNYSNFQKERRAGKEAPYSLMEAEAKAKKAMNELNLQDIEKESKQADLESKRLKNKFDSETAPDRKSKIKADLELAKVNKQLKELQLSNKKDKESDIKKRNADRIGAVINESELVFSDIKRFEDAIQNQSFMNPATGLTAKIVRSAGVPGSAAVNLEALKSTIISHIALNKISELKSQSKTGATGFGQLSEKELKLLTDSIASLDLNQSAENLLKNIGIIEDQYKKILQKIKNDPKYQDYLDYMGERNKTPSQSEARKAMETAPQQPAPYNIPDQLKNRSYWRFLK